MISRIFLWNLAAALLLTVVFLLVVRLAIHTYTDHGESFAVPDFRGMSLEEVEQTCREKKLVYMLADSTYAEHITPGSVIDQFPLAGFQVKEGRTVSLTICARNPEQVAVPKLTDISLRQALSILQQSGLKTGQIDYVVSEYPNLVLEQLYDEKSIVAGETVDRGSAIDLVVGRSGSGELTVVPALTGAGFGQAVSELAVMNLMPGAVIYDESVKSREDSLNARVWRQRPGAVQGRFAEVGSSVDLWLTIDEEKLGTTGFIGETENAETE